MCEINPYYQNPIIFLTKQYIYYIYIICYIIHCILLYISESPGSIIGGQARVRKNVTFCKLFFRKCSIFFLILLVKNLLHFLENNFIFRTLGPAEANCEEYRSFNFGDEYGSPRVYSKRMANHIPARVAKQKILENPRKFQEILENSKTFQRILENFRKFNNFEGF